MSVPEVEKAATASAQQAGDVEMSDVKPSTANGEVPVATNGAAKEEGAQGDKEEDAKKILKQSELSHDFCYHASLSLTFETKTSSIRSFQSSSTFPIRTFRQINTSSHSPKQTAPKAPAPEQAGSPSLHYPPSNACESFRNGVYHSSLSVSEPPQNCSKSIRKARGSEERRKSDRPTMPGLGAFTLKVSHLKNLGTMARYFRRGWRNGSRSLDMSMLSG